MIHDRVTTLGTGVDGAVRRLSATFDVRGLVTKLTSHSNPTVGSGVVVNDVGLAYNSFGQVISDAQSHNLGVSGTTPKVQYSYANGSTNTIRPTTLTYPNGRALTIGYGTSGGINDAASRVDGLIDGATTLVNYAYLGLGTTVQTTYPQPALQYTLIGVSGGTSPAGDIYWGLDQFGRIIDSHWCKTTAGNAVIDRIKYGYDRASNRIWRQNPVATAAGTKFDEFYTNDGLQRLKDMQRGTLNGTNTAITSPTFSQCWTLDPTDNWRGFSESTTGSTWTLTQARTSNTVNEITGITNSVGGAWTAPAYDPAGNMTTMPRPGTPSSSYTAVYDAWNRLVSIKAGAVDVQQYQYDARNFRTVILSYTSGVLSETRHSYFTSNWRCIEERAGTSTNAERHFVWGARYIDDCVLRDRDTTGGGTLNDRKYALQDANWNMSALTVSNGLVGERYAYTPYGKPIFLSAAFIPRSTSSYAWEILYCGYRYDAGTQLYSVRFRSYHSVLGVWLVRDFLNTIESLRTLYLYGSAMPLTHLDPLGLDDAGNTAIGINVALSTSHVGLTEGEQLAALLYSHFPILHPQNAFIGPSFMSDATYERSMERTRYMRIRQIAELLANASEDVQRAVNACGDDENCLSALGALFIQIANTPSQGFYRQTPNKCFNWLEDFLRNYPTYNPSTGRIVLGNGSLTLEPQELDTRSGARLVTSRSVLGMATGSMTAHGVVKVTFSPVGQPSTYAYFDLGSSTHLGHYGGTDHWFWPGYVEGFELEMDVQQPKMFNPNNVR